MVIQRRRVAAWTTASATLLAVLSVSACSFGEHYTPAYTYRQAAALVEHGVHGAVAHLTPTPTLAIAGRLYLPCTDANDENPTGDLMIERGYWLRGLDPAHNQDVFDQMKRYWNTNGYTVIRDEAPQPITTSQTTVARNPSGFSMSLVQGAGGDFSLSAQSPCVHPDTGDDPSPAAT